MTKKEKKKLINQEFEEIEEWKKAKKKLKSQERMKKREKEKKLEKNIRHVMFAFLFLIVSIAIIEFMSEISKNTCDDECIFNKVISEGVLDPSLCLTLENLDYVMLCYTQIAYKTDNYGTCNLIYTFPNMVNGERKTGLCYSNIALKLNDYSICDKTLTEDSRFACNYGFEMGEIVGIPEKDI